MTDSSAAIRELSLEALGREIQEVRERLNRFRTGLGRFFVDRQPVIDLMTISAIAQEPLLLVGAPGTAKSELVTKFRDAMQVPVGDYFEYMLTRFTEPSEIIGPIDIRELKEGRYLRRVQGKLPTARLVFLDEIFKSSSAILNTLLTIINERKFYQDGVAVPVDLEILFAATNQIPDLDELAALKDRFCLKVRCNSVADSHFLELLDAGLDARAQREANQAPWAEGHASREDFLKAHRYLTLLMAEREPRDRSRYFGDALVGELRRLIKTLTREDGVVVSDRRIIKLYRLIRTRAWLLRGGKVERDDLGLLAHVGERGEDLELLAAKVPKLLGLS